MELVPAGPGSAWVLAAAALALAVSEVAVVEEGALVEGTAAAEAAAPVGEKIVAGSWNEEIVVGTEVEEDDCTWGRGDCCS